MFLLKLNINLYWMFVEYVDLKLFIVVLIFLNNKNK